MRVEQKAVQARRQHTDMLGYDWVDRQECGRLRGYIAWKKGYFQMGKTGMYVQAEGREAAEGRK